MWLVFEFWMHINVVPCCYFFQDLDKIDNEKNEMNQTDIAALRHFYSKHLDIPSNAALAELFAQVSYFTMFFRFLIGDTALLT